jgi:hypothetical protein
MPAGNQPRSSDTSHQQNRPKVKEAVVLAEQTGAEIELSQLPPRPIGAEAADGWQGLAPLLWGPRGIFGAGSVENQAARLGDARLLTVQRQALAAQIGRVQGNRHLQRVVSSLKRDEEPIPDLKPGLQRDSDHQLHYEHPQCDWLRGEQLVIAQQRIWANQSVHTLGGSRHPLGEARAMMVVSQPVAGQASVDAAHSQMPTLSSLSEIAHRASRASTDPGIGISWAGSPAQKAPPGGLGYIMGKGSGGLGISGGLTLRKNAAAFTAPSFVTKTETIKKGYQREHFVTVEPTASADVTHECYYPGSGEHERPGMTQEIEGRTYTYYWGVSPGISKLIRKGEQEHLNDLLRAYELTYRLIADKINSLVGQRFGPAQTPFAAEQLAEAALRSKLPKQLARPQDWPKMLDTLLNATDVRDDKGWHALDIGPPRTKGNKIIHPVQKTDTTKIGEVSSEQVVNYPPPQKAPETTSP